MARSTDEAVWSTRTSTFCGVVVGVTGGLRCAPLTPVSSSRLVNARAVSPASRAWANRKGSATDVAVDHAVHVEDVALLAWVEAEGVEATGLHADLHLAEVGVVLVGDLAPILGRPVGVVATFGHRALVVRRSPFEDPDVL